LEAVYRDRPASPSRHPAWASFAGVRFGIATSSDSELVVETGTTDASRPEFRSRLPALVAWFVVAAGAGLTAALEFDARPALAVVVAARVLRGVPVGAACLVSAGVVTFVVSGHVGSSEPDVPTAVVVTLVFMIEAVALSHLVLVLMNRLDRRENPLRRFAVFSVVVVVVSLVLAAIESVLVGVAIDESVTSFGERGAAVTVGSLLGLCAVILVRGRWWRYQGLFAQVDELFAPLMALAIMVLALQVTGENWRSPVKEVRVTTAIDGTVEETNEEPEVGFGMNGRRTALVLTFEVLLGAAVIAVLLLGASAQVRVELERRRRESLLEAALDATPGLSVVFDQNMRVLAGNRVVRDAHADRIPGIPVIEVLGFGPETVRARIVAELLAKVLGGEGGHAEVSGGQGEEMRISELEAYPVSVPGDERIGFLHVSDTTERRSVAMRTAQSERMESLGALAGGLAHDFNNLLFVTLGNLQLMAMNETITKDEKLAKFLSRSMAAVERGAEITKSLLAVARSQPLEETAVSLADLIKGLLPLVKQAVGAGRTVEVDIPDPNLHLMVDAGRLQSCILNLAFNSRDAMGPNGRVRISARRREDMIELSVADDGAGMPAEVVSRAFEPFFTTKKAGSGTGLGLATVYAFAQQSGGTATLESRPGVGTTVTLVLPLHVPGVKSERVVSTRRAGRRVVVADDEQALAEMVAAWLIDVGIDARFALSPREALELISEFRPDVLVSDANFGLEQDGLDLARLATADQPDLAVIFMTGYSSSMRQLQELGERTLAKPFSREDLYVAVLPLVANDGAAANHALDRSERGEGHG